MSAQTPAYASNYNFAAMDMCDLQVVTDFFPTRYEAAYVAAAREEVARRRAAIHALRP